MRSAGLLSLLMAPLLLKAKLSSASASGAQTLGRLLFYGLLLMRSCHSEQSWVISGSLLQRASKDQSACWYFILHHRLHLCSFAETSSVHHDSQWKPHFHVPFWASCYSHVAATGSLQLMLIMKPRVFVKTHDGHKSKHSPNQTQNSDFFGGEYHSH